MLMDYWLACYLGRAWLLLRSILHLRSVNEGLPEACRQVASGDGIPASMLFIAQDFAVRVWWRVGMAAILLVFPVIGVTAALRPGRVGTDISVAITFGLASVAAVAVGQAGMIRYRSYQTRRSLWTPHDKPQANPALSGMNGQPHKADFWVMSAFALGVSAILIYAGTRPAGH